MWPLFSPGDLGINGNHFVITDHNGAHREILKELLKETRIEASVDVSRLC